WESAVKTRCTARSRLRRPARRGCSPAHRSTPQAKTAWQAAPGPPGDTQGPNEGDAALALALLPALVTPHPGRDLSALAPDSHARLPRFFFEPGQRGVAHELATAFHIGPGHAAHDLALVGRNAVVKGHIANAAFVAVALEAQHRELLARDQPRKGLARSLGHGLA